MRYLVVGVSTNEQWQALKLTFDTLPFVELKLCPATRFAVEAELDLEIVSALYHEVVGGQPTVGKAQILPTYRIRRLAPWVAFLPPLEYEWDVRCNETGEAELYYFRRSSPVQDLKYQFEVLFERLMEFDSQYPGRLRRIGFHMDVIFAGQIDQDILSAVVEVFSTRRDFFEAFETSKKATLSTSEACVILRQWLMRYEVNTVTLPDGEVLTPVWAPAYWLNSVFQCGELVDVELVSYGEKLLILLSGTVGVESSQDAGEQRSGIDLEISDFEVAILVRRLRGAEVRTWTFSTGKIQLSFANLNP